MDLFHNHSNITETFGWRNTTSDGNPPLYDLPVAMITSRTLENEPSDADADSGDGWGTFAKATSNALLFLLIFGMSATVDMQSVLKQLNNKYAILTGVGMQFVIMPFLGYIAVVSLRDSGLNTPMGLTLLIVTSSPGGSYSNWWCSVFNADLALSVTMTALSTLLSSFLLPANLVLYGHLAYGIGHNGGGGEDDDGDAKGDHVLENVDFTTLFVSLAVVISAIFAGLYASYQIKSVSFRRWANRFGTFSGITLILFSAVLSSFITGEDEDDTEQSTPIWSQDWSFFVGVSMPCVLGLLIANFLSRFTGLSKPETVTVSVECCYQNVGIATSAAVAMFDDPIDRADALSVPLLYGLLEAVLLGLYCVWAWKVGWTKAPKNENCCTVISTTYEIDEDDEIEEMGVVNFDEEGHDFGPASPGHHVPRDRTVSTDSIDDDGNPDKRLTMALRRERRGENRHDDASSETFRTNISVKRSGERRSVLGWLFNSKSRRTRHIPTTIGGPGALDPSSATSSARRRSSTLEGVASIPDVIDEFDSPQCRKDSDDSCDNECAIRNRMQSDDSTKATSTTGGTDMDDMATRWTGGRQRMSSGDDDQNNTVLAGDVQFSEAMAPPLPPSSESTARTASARSLGSK